MRPSQVSDPEAGQVSVLIAGLVAIVLTLVLGVVGATSVQLARIHLLDAADAAALDAADEVDEVALYGAGLGTGVPLSGDAVQRAAGAHLAARQLPARLASWEVAPGTGTPDGRTAVVHLRGEAAVPVVSRLLRWVGGGITVHVESRARSDLRE